MEFCLLSPNIIYSLQDMGLICSLLTMHQKQEINLLDPSIKEMK